MKKRNIRVAIGAKYGMSNDGDDAQQIHTIEKPK